MASRAAFWASSVANSTKPKPLLLLEAFLAAVFKDCVFKFNFASDYGGGVLVQHDLKGGVATSLDLALYHSPTATLFITKLPLPFKTTNTPTSQRSPNGGVVVIFSTTSDYPNFGSVEFSSCTVAFNSANEGDGGVAWMDGYKPSFPEAAAVMEMQDSAFIGNSAGGASSWTP
ncbi:hypothetical protein QOT17_021880 [Balamuthia mandrillaris]